MAFGVLMGQIAVIFLEVMLGYAGARCGVITDRDSRFLSDFIMMLLLPCTMLAGAAIDDEPEIVLPQNAACLRLPGTDGKAKMSKSLGNCIYLSDEPEDIKKKIMSMYTDPNHLRVQDPGKVEGNPVFIYLDAFSRPEHFAEFLPEYQNLDELKAHYQRGGLGDVKVKKFLNSVMQAELEPIRNRRKEWEQRLPEVVEILKEGSAVAEKTAAATLAEVRKSMKIDYFTDDNLLK